MPAPSTREYPPGFRSATSFQLILTAVRRHSITVPTPQTSSSWCTKQRVTLVTDIRNSVTHIGSLVPGLRVRHRRRSAARWTCQTRKVKYWDDVSAALFWALTKINSFLQLTHHCKFSFQVYFFTLPVHILILDLVSHVVNRILSR